MMQPPHNPWLRDEDLATQRSRFWGTSPPQPSKKIVKADQTIKTAVTAGTRGT